MRRIRRGGCQRKAGDTQRSAVRRGIVFAEIGLVETGDLLRSDEKPSCPVLDSPGSITIRMGETSNTLIRSLRFG